jgi:hypothetical protein
VGCDGSSGADDEQAPVEAPQRWGAGCLAFVAAAAQGACGG